MKNVFKFAVAAFCVAALAVSCQIATEIEAPEQNSNLVTLRCEFPSILGVGTKATLDGDKKTCWEVNDQIVFQGCPKSGVAISPVVHTIIASEIVDPRVANITVDLSSLVADEGTPKMFNAAYPADIWSSYSSSHTYGRSRFTGGTNRLLMAGYIEDDMSSITFNLLTGVILFKVPADLAGLVDSYTLLGNGSEVLGYDRYLVEINSNDPTYLAKLGTAEFGTLDPVTSLSGPVTADGSTVHAVYIQNEANFTDGFTIQFKKSGDVKYTISTSSALHLVHGHGVDLGTLPMSKIHAYVAPATHDATNPAIAGATDLGASGTANCYIVDGSDDGNQNKVFKFKAYKGNSSTSVGSVASVEVLWETYNTTAAVTENTVIAAVDFDKQAENDYYEIVFKMPATLHAGNAVIAARNAFDDILWSWHIWVPSTAISYINESKFSSKTAMSRNLGALVDATIDTATPVESYGLLYEWGRKDPFVGLGSTSSNVAATVAGTAQSVATGPASIETTVQNPTKYIYKSSGCWLVSEGSDTTPSTLWHEAGVGSKTIYDPCPPGYMLPARNKSCAFFNSDAAMTSGTDYTLSTENKSFSVGSLIFPLAGYIKDSDGTHSKTGTRTIIWTGRYDSGGFKAYGMYGYIDDGTTFKTVGNYRARAGSVRCVAE